MKALEVYYHFYIPENHQVANYCNWWLDSQLKTLIESRLHDHAKINMCITMPKYWDNILGIHIKDNTFYNVCTFEYKIREYIDFRYPFINIIDIRDTSEPNIYEGHTLKYLHDKSQTKDMYALYFHNKGMVSNKFTVGTWRETLDHFLITKWRECVRLLEDADVVGMSDRFLPISSNFFWADNVYIQQRPNPLESDKYILPEESDLAPWGPAYRYAFEKWILRGNPTIANIHETNLCHYSNYYLKERL